MIRKISQMLQKWVPPKIRNKEDISTKVLRWIGLVAICLLPFILIYYGPKLFQRTVVFKQKMLPKTIEGNHSQNLSIRAAELAKQGDFREAIRYLYLANLEYLKINGFISNGILLTDKANLNQLRRKLGNDHLGFQSFSKLTNIFQEKWYGLKECQHSDYDQAVDYMNSIYKYIGKSDV